MTSVDSASTFSQPKVVEKAFSLPIVCDSYSYGLDTVSSLTSALQPYLSSLACPSLSSSLASLPPLLSSHLSSLQALAEERLPGMVTAKLYTGRDQMIAGVQYLDSTLCSGLDLLIVKVPSLTSPSPALYSSTREAAVSQLTLATTYLATTTTQATTYLASTTTQATTYLASTTTQATTYLASFTLGQLALKVSDCGLETAESLLKLAPASCSSHCEPIVSGLETVRGKVDRVRREGARINGSQKVANMESSSLLSAVSEVFGLNYVLNILGLAEVIAKAGSPGEVSKEVILEKVEAAAEVIEEDVPKKVEARRSPRLSRKSSAL